MQAAESSMAAMAMAFAACLGTKDQQSNCCLLNFSKRRRAGDPHPPQIVHIRGEMAQMLDANDTHVVDVTTKRIVSREEYSQFAGVGADMVNTVAAARGNAVTGAL
jgi:hypothetical protein